jgi:sorbose reductase
MGVFLTAQESAKHMKSSGGSLILIASIAAHQPIPGNFLPAYGMSKGGVLALSRHLAVELAPLNIRVNTISPGYIAIDMTAGLLEQEPQLEKVFKDEPPLKRMGERRDLMGAVV